INFNDVSSCSSGFLIFSMFYTFNLFFGFPYQIGFAELLFGRFDLSSIIGLFHLHAYSYH
ncbi:unnamed protein product, partial [Brassica oleracea var. botrytis]